MESYGGEWAVFSAENAGVKKAYQKLICLFLKQNICCGYSKEPSQWDSSFEHPKHMLKLMGKKILTILRWETLFN